jgi:hypothetical protein
VITDPAMRDEYDFSKGVRGKYAERYAARCRNGSDSNGQKVLLLHLSDLHIKAKDDSVLSRANLLADAVKNIEPDASVIVCVLSGDIAYAGTDEQFTLAYDFIKKIEDRLAKNLPKSKIYFVAVPGNHDCDFTEATEARAVLRDVVIKSPNRLQDESFADICLAPLRRFFQFVGTLNLPASADGPHSRLYQEYRVDLGGASLLLCCCNSAILSELHEKPGSLVFPNSILPQARSNADVSVGVVHHPYNWLTPDCAKQFRERIESITDFILTGHEHVLDRRTVSAQGTNNLYLEGGVLQDNSNPDVSEFYCVVVDTGAKKQRIIGFTWNGERYVPAGGDDPGQYHLWEDFAANRLRQREKFQILPEFSAYLDDPELTLVHRAKGELKLSDIYVFPDLRRVNLAGEKITKIIPGESIGELVTTSPCLFIIGDDVSGKTALAKSLFRHLHGIGDVPLLVDVANATLSADKCAEQLEQHFLRTYQPSALNAYRQLDRVSRVVIIDNWHRLQATSKERVALLEELRKQSFRLIVLAHDIAITLHDMSEAGEAIAGELPFSYYSILPFSQLRRNRLVETWLLLGGRSDEDTAAFVQNLTRVTEVINTLIGENYVPAYPPYVLAVLQGVEAGTDIDVNASTHGYLYELFIKAAVAKAGSAGSYNIISTFLAQLSFWLFRQQKREITESQLRAFHSELHERFEVMGDFSTLIDQLLHCRLVRKYSDIFAFRHPYIYYYFLAAYLRDHITEPAVRATIETLAGQLYKDESASTLLFLAHLSKDRVILETLLKAAEIQYADSKEATLESDVKFLNKLETEIPKLKLSERKLRETRNELLEAADRNEEQQRKFEEKQKAEIESAKSALGRLNASLKTMQILGQVLKNFPADFDREEKDLIIASCCALGQRVLGNLLTSIRENETLFLEDMVQLIAKRRANLPPQKLKERAASAVFALTELAATGVIIRVSHALGSKDLTTTYERTFPDLKAEFLKLVYVALRLEHYADFPEGLIRDEAKALQKNAFAFRVLRDLVVRYLMMFPTDFRLKQQLSQTLKLDFQRVRNPQKEQRLLR